MLVQNLKNSREYILNITQDEVAKRLKRKRSTICGWENDIDHIPIKMLIEYANTYNLSLDYLFGISSNIWNYEKIILDETNKQEIGRRLKNLRIQNNFTEEKLANILNYSQAAYSYYEAGKNIVSTTVLSGIIKLYKNFSIDELFGRKSNK